MGISRRTYYYRLKQTNCTSPHQVNLKQSSQQPVQSTKHQVSKKEVAEQELSTIKSVGTPQAHKPEMSVTDTDKLLMTLTCAMREQTRSRVTVLPPGVKPDAVPTWAAMLQPDMAAIAAVAWFYGSLPRVGLAA